MTENPSVTTTIVDPGRDIVTLINVFTVKPESQQQFVAAQTGEYKRLQHKIAGSLSANLHRGLSGTRALNYAQFHSVEELYAWQRSDLMKQHLPAIQPYIERAEPGLYRVVEVVSRAGRVARIEAGPERLALVTVMFARDASADALDQLAAGQGSAARELLDQIPALRSLILHRGLGEPRREDAIGPAGQAVIRASRPDLALYAQLDTADAARALTEHPLYRAWFTTDHAYIGRTEHEIYEVAYVQNEAALSGSPQ